MKALSIRQPWAWAIMTVGKRIENRSWKTSYRGPLLIHASSGCTRQEYEAFCYWWLREFPRRPLKTVQMPPPPGDLPRGGIVGMAEVTGCVQWAASPWFFGPFGLVLDTVRPLPFIPCKGALGIYDVDPAVVAGVHAATRHTHEGAVQCQL